MWLNIAFCRSYKGLPKWFEAPLHDNHITCKALTISSQPQAVLMVQARHSTPGHSHSLGPAVLTKAPKHFQGPRSHGTWRAKGKCCGVFDLKPAERFGLNSNHNIDMQIGADQWWTAFGDVFFRVLSLWELCSEKASSNPILSVFPEGRAAASLRWQVPRALNWSWACHTRTSPKE